MEHMGYEMDMIGNVIASQLTLIFFAEGLVETTARSEAFWIYLDQTAMGSMDHNGSPLSPKKTDRGSTRVSIDVLASLQGVISGTRVFASCLMASPTLIEVTKQHGHNQTLQTKHCGVMHDYI